MLWVKVANEVVTSPELAVVAEPLGRRRSETSNDEWRRLKAERGARVVEVWPMTGRVFFVQGLITVATVVAAKKRS